MIDVQELIPCLYCGGDAKLYEKNARHPYAPRFGPFNIYQCKACSSLLTNPVPSAHNVSALYASFEKGMHKNARELRTRYPLHTWFRQCQEHMLKETGLDLKTNFSWIDIGAGEGEMSNLMRRQFPSTKGTGVDFLERPGKLDGSVSWIKTDLSGDITFIKQADLVFAITVFEHMRDPVHFIRSCLGLMKPGAVMYFNCPRADCNAFRIMGRKWPYYLPGEHLTIPSINGVETLMHRECLAKFGDKYTLKTKPVIIPYPLGFYLGYILPFTKRLFSLSTDVYFPTGMLECKLILHE